MLPKKINSLKEQNSVGEGLEKLSPPTSFDLVGERSQKTAEHFQAYNLSFDSLIKNASFCNATQQKENQKQSRF